MSKRYRTSMCVRLTAIAVGIAAKQLAAREQACVDFKPDNRFIFGR